MLVTGGSSHIYSWGMVRKGRLGFGDVSGVERTILQPTGVSLQDKTAIPTGIAVGLDNTCVTVSGDSSSIHVWGDNHNGQLGFGTIAGSNGNNPIFPVGVMLGTEVTGKEIAFCGFHFF